MRLFEIVSNMLGNMKIESEKCQQMAVSPMPKMKRQRSSSRKPKCRDDWTSGMCSVQSLLRSSL